MFRANRFLLLITAAALLAGTRVQAQQHAPNSGSAADSGMYEYGSFTTAHDASAGWAANLNSAVGYDFHQHLAFEVGVPFYLVTTSSATSTSTTSTTTTTTRSGSLGDIFVRMRAAAHSDPVDCTTAFTVTAPTGDRSAGISTGRSTFTWDNRFEHGFSHITPFAEGSLGNSLSSSLRYMRSYTTLGGASEFRGGASFDFTRYLNLETSGYGDVGYGNQKIYSHKVGKGLAGNANANAKHSRPFDTTYLTSGTGSLVNDYGLGADFNVNPTPRFGFDLAYNYSAQFALNSVSFTVGYRLGHTPKEANRN
jgi:hypothetical protein